MSSVTVLTLLASPVEERLTEDTVSAVASSLEASGLRLTGEDWLARGEACDLFMEGEPTEAMDKAVRTALKDRPYDFILQPQHIRRKKGLIADMDSTIITVECVDELADYAGVKAQVADITSRAMNGELDFRDALRERVRLLENLSESVLQDTYSDRVHFSSGARELVQTMHRHGSFCMLVSGGFTYFTSRVKDALGFNLDQANELEIRDGKLTGKVIEPILDKDAKLHAFKWMCEEKNIDPLAVLAIGDGANDIPMLMAAGLGVAYRAKPTVRQQISAQLNYCDLSALLYAQGYRKEDFIS